MDKNYIGNTTSKSLSLFFLKHLVDHHGILLSSIESSEWVRTDCDSKMYCIDIFGDTDKDTLYMLRSAFIDFKWGYRAAKGE